MEAFDAPLGCLGEQSEKCSPCSLEVMHPAKKSGKSSPASIVGDKSKTATEDHRLLWNTKTVCEALSIHPRTLARMEKSGKLRSVGLLRHKRFARVDVVALVEGLRAWQP